MFGTAKPKKHPMPDTPYQLNNLYVIEEGCKFSADHSSAKIMIASANPDFPRAIEELGSADARNLGAAYAAEKGVGDPRINGNVEGPFPVNDDGVPLEKVAESMGEEVDPTHIKMQVAGYRCVVPICRKLV